MRMVLLTTVAAIGLGFVGSSAGLAAPAYGASMDAAAARLDLRQDAYVVRRPYYRSYSRRYRHCFQDCPGRQ